LIHAHTVRVLLQSLRCNPVRRICRCSPSTAAGSYAGPCWTVRISRLSTGHYGASLLLGELHTILVGVSHESALITLGSLMRELRQAAGMSLTGTAQAQVPAKATGRYG
jgi:hypothetical protein